MILASLHYLLLFVIRRGFLAYDIWHSVSAEVSRTQLRTRGGQVTRHSAVNKRDSIEICSLPNSQSFRMLPCVANVGNVFAHTLVLIV